MRVKLQHRLHLGGQGIETSAHVRDVAGNISADIPGRADQDNAAKIRRSAASPASLGTRNFSRSDTWFAGYPVRPQGSGFFPLMQTYNYLRM